MSKPNNLELEEKISEIASKYWNNSNCPVLKAQNGYLKLANGLILQWGRVSIPTNQNTASISFTIGFNTYPFCTIANAYVEEQISYAVDTPISAVSDKYSVTVKSARNAKGGGIGVFFIAVGI